MGLTIFKKMTHYFELTRNQRQQDDSQYLQILRNIRNFSVTPEDYDYLNRNCTVNLEKQSDEWFTTTTFIVNENAPRVKWNQKIVQKYSRLHQTPVYTIVGHDVLKMQLESINDAVFSLVDEKIAGGLQKRLYLAIGMPVLFTENLHKYLGACNGSQGILTGLVFDEINEIQALKIRLNSVERFQIDGLDENTIIVERKSHQEYVSYRDVYYQFTRSQYPIREGFCWTAHKAQGCTLNKAVLCLNDRGGTSAYVKLSRTKTSRSTFIMPGFTIDNLVINRNPDYTAWRKTLEEGINQTKLVVDAIHDFSESQ